jgi:hypothetical protein
MRTRTWLSLFFVSLTWFRLGQGWSQPSGKKGLPHNPQSSPHVK